MTAALALLALAAAFAAGVLRGCLTGRRDIWTVCGDAVYLQRWYLAGGRHEDTDHPAPVALFLHRMLLPDPDRDPHDHPWSFLTLVLWGGYVEEVTRPLRHNYSSLENPHRKECPSADADDWGVKKDKYDELWAQCKCTVTHTHHCRPGTLHWRPAEHTHRIDRLPRGTAVTLVLRMPRRRKWGFLTAQGWVPWGRHLAKRKSEIC